MTGAPCRRQVIEARLVDDGRRRQGRLGFDLNAHRDVEKEKGQCLLAALEGAGAALGKLAEERRRHVGGQMDGAPALLFEWHPCGRVHADKPRVDVSQSG